MRRFINMDFASLLEDTAEALGIPVDGLTFDYDAADDLDWAALARSVGEPVDPLTWQAWAHERERLCDEAELNSGGEQ